MSLSERHRWCVAKLLDAFKPELTQEQVQQFIRKEENLQKFSAFFRGDLSGRLFVFFQPDQAIGEVCVFLQIRLTFIVVIIIIFIIVIIFIFIIFILLVMDGSRHFSSKTADNI